MGVMALGRDRMLKKPVWLSVALVVAFAGAICLLPVARSVTTTSLTVDPLTSTVAVGAQRTVDIVVRDVADLYGIQLEITFDPSKVEVVDADLGTPGVQIDPGTCPSPDFVVTNAVSNALGTGGYAASALNPSLPCDGDGVVASITFLGLAEGETAIQFSDWLLSDRDGLEIQTAADDGSLVVEGLSRVFVPIVLRSG
jgi:hypothetical protein